MVNTTRGALGARTTPQDKEKNLKHNLQGKVVSAPLGRVRVKFLGHILLGGEICRVGVVNLVVLACALRAMTKKVVNFFKGKSAPQGEIQAMPMDTTMNNQLISQ